MPDKFLESRSGILDVMRGSFAKGKAEIVAVYDTTTREDPDIRNSYP